MTHKLLVSVTFIAVIIGFSSANAVVVDTNPLKAAVHQDEDQYKHDQEVLKPIQDQINTLNQQIEAQEKPFLDKYRGLDDALQRVDKPYQDQINALNQQMQQADQPYRDQIRQRNEEQRRIDEETRGLREQIKHLNESSWQQRKALEEDARKLQADSAAERNMEPQNHANQNQVHTNVIQTKTTTQTPNF